MERGPTSTRSTITRVLTYRTGRNTEQWGFDTFVARNSYKASALEYCVSITRPRVMRAYRLYTSCRSFVRKVLCGIFCGHMTRRFLSHCALCTFPNALYISLVYRRNRSRIFDYYYRVMRARLYTSCRSFP